MRAWLARRGIYDAAMFAAQASFVVLASVAFALLLVRISMLVAP